MKIRKWQWLISLCWVATLCPAPAIAQIPDAAALMQSSDRARGGGLPGLIWEVDLITQSNAEAVSAMKMRIKATDTSSVAETLEPVRSKGSKMLRVDRQMWLTKPGLKKPVPISVRQRLSGQASIGDIAATNYVRDYVATLLREDNKFGERCYVLELKALSNQATYDRLYYWISSARGVALHAEFLSLSGMRLKTADFDYGNIIQVDGKPLPFVSKMTIVDELTSDRTTLRYSKVQVVHVPAREFSLSNLE